MSDFEFTLFKFRVRIQEFLLSQASTGWKPVVSIWMWEEHAGDETQEALLRGAQGVMGTLHS